MKPYFILFLALSISAIAKSNPDSPFAWTVEKDGKTSYILGTVHAGVPLEDIPCADTLSEKIQNSDLLFVENATIKGDFERLSEEEQQKLFTGSAKEQVEIMSRLSIETQEEIRERKAAFINILKDMFTYSYIDVSGESYTELSSENQDFLINHGLDTEDSYAELIYRLNAIAYYRAYHSLPSLDKQVKQMALSHSVEIKPLDNNKRLNKDFYNKASSNKPIQFVGLNDVEETINSLDNITELYQQILLNPAKIYQFYDDMLFQTPNKGLDHQILLKNRNKLWLEKFLTAREEYESIFLAGGLKHFIGDDSLLNMLEQEGFSIQRITCPNAVENKTNK